MTDLVVIGGGISGLAAAWEGRRQGAEVVVLEATDRPGGKLQTSRFAGVPLDEAADAFLARVPEAVDLCAELGLDGDLVSPTAGSAYVFCEQGLRRLPSEQVLGVPTDIDAVAASGILSAEGIERARADLTAPADSPDGDEAVGALVRRRLGDEVLDRLVGPLIGGTWAADCDRLSLQTATPALAAARERGPSLIEALAATRAETLARQGDTPAPVFFAPRGGLGRLIGALTDALGDQVRTGQDVTAIERDGTRWRIEPAGITADAVVVATPAFAAAPLLVDLAPEAADHLGAVDYASVTLVGLALPRAAIEHPLDGSGFLVSRTAGRFVTACSWVNTKWGHLDIDPDVVVLRASAGHAGDDRAMSVPDDALVAAMMIDLREIMGIDPAATPIEVRINRWAQSFPQPRPGHAQVVDAIDASLASAADRITATGAWRLGVGIPACIRGARAAADRALAGVTSTDA